MKRQRIGDEDRVVVEAEAAAEGEQQPQERHRQRDQRPAELIGVGPAACRPAARDCPGRLAGSIARTQPGVSSSTVELRSAKTSPLSDVAQAGASSSLLLGDLRGRVAATVFAARPMSLVRLASSRRARRAPRAPRPRHLSRTVCGRRGSRAAGKVEHREHQEDAEQEQSAIGETNRARSPSM